jgi:nucleotide-binding universal stress UspA family protein
MDSPSTGATWVVGLDLRARSDGAMLFASWVTRSSRSPHHLVAVHVLEDPALLTGLHERHLAVLEAAARDVATSVLTHHAPAASCEVSIMAGHAAEDGLETAAAQCNAEALVIGRAAPREGRHLLRLGRVARHVLRHAAVPVIVVPPDLPADPGGGPVVVATDLGPASEAATRFGITIADRLQRPLVVAHVMPEIDHWGARVMPADAIAETARAEEDASGAALQQWCTQRGCGHAERVLMRGSTPRRLLELTRQRKAVLVVTGSRRLSAADRILVTSVGSELAAIGSCAVAVVPAADIGR